MIDMFESIKAVVMDVDGVLTDGTFWWGLNGEEFKRFCFADVTSIHLARRAGIRLALVSGESSHSGMGLVQRYADKLEITDVYKGCHDKAEAVRHFAQTHRLSLPEICFIGDDVQDLPAMDIVGLAAAPADARPEVLANAAFIATHGGGHGAVRDLIDSIFAARTASQPASTGKE